MRSALTRQDPNTIQTALNSWKVIASFLDRGVRTVQRWEQELGLPVRRPRGKQRSAVIALTPDLDSWLHKVPQGTLTSHPGNTKKRENLHVTTELLLKQTHQIMERSHRMHERVRNTLVLTSKLREKQLQRNRERRLGGQSQMVLVAKTTDCIPRMAPAREEAPELRQYGIQKSTGAGGR